MHILLFILIFIIAIFVFGLSIVGFILRTIFGLGRSSSSSRPKQTESGRTSQQSYNQTNRRSNDDEEIGRATRLNSSHREKSRMPSSA